VYGQNLPRAVSGTGFAYAIACVAIRPSDEPGHLLRHNAHARCAMLRYALIFLIVAIIAGVLGFGVVEGTAAWIAKVLAVIFVVLFLIGLLTGRRPPVT
jgi:uncharacterized membrane protein YtjA (UPF0391 family)